MIVHSKIARYLLAFLLSMCLTGLLSACQPVPLRNPWEAVPESETIAPKVTTSSSIHPEVTSSSSISQRISVSQLQSTTSPVIEKQYDIRGYSIVFDAEVEILAESDALCLRPTITPKQWDFDQISKAAFGEHFAEALAYTKARPDQFPIPSYSKNTHYLYDDGHMLFFTQEQGLSEDNGEPYQICNFTEYFSEKSGWLVGSDKNTIAGEETKMTMIPQEAIGLVNQALARYPLGNISFYQPVVRALRSVGKDGEPYDLYSIRMSQSYGGIALSDFSYGDSVMIGNVSALVSDEGLLELTVNIHLPESEIESDMSVLPLIDVLPKVAQYAQIILSSDYSMEKSVTYRAIQFAYCAAKKPGSAGYQLVPAWFFAPNKDVQEAMPLIVDAMTGEMLLLK